MTKREAAIISAYTGILLGDFGEMHEYIETLFGHPVYTHEMGDENFFEKLKTLSKPDFLSIKIV